MAKEFFKNLPNTTTPLTAERLNGLLDGEEALGNIVVDSIKTTNLLNPNTLINGSVSASDGSYSNVNYVVVSDYIPVEANKPYTIKLNNITNSQFLFRIVLYNTSKSFSSTLHTGSEVTQKTITPAIDGYVRICFGLDGYKVLSPVAITQANPQFEQNSSASTYKPYIEFGINNYKNDNIVVGGIRSKNMFNIDKVLTNTAISSGVIISDSNNDIFVVEVGFNTTYTISKTSYNGGVLGFSSTFPVIGDTLTDRQSLANLSKITVTSPEKKYLCLMISHSDNKNTIQVEEGSEVTNYMPYGRLFNSGSDVIVAGSTSSTTLNGNTDLDYNVSLTIPSGYKAIGIVGYYIHGAYSTRVTITGFYLYNSTTAKFIGRNMGNDTATLAIDVFVLCIKM